MTTPAPPPAPPQTALPTAPPPLTVSRRATARKVPA